VSVRTSRPAPQPAALLRQARQDLAARGDPVRAESTKVYFKKSEPIFLYGLSVPETRAMAREYVQMVRGAWGVGEAIEFATLAVAERETEAKFIGMMVLARFRREFPRSLAATVRRWLAAGQCNNWALVDALSAEVLAPLLDRHPALVPAITAWSGSSARHATKIATSSSRACRARRSRRWSCRAGGRSFRA